MYGVSAFFFASRDELDAETQRMAMCFLIMCDLLDTLLTINRSPPGPGRLMQQTTQLMIEFQALWATDKYTWKFHSALNLP